MSFDNRLSFWAPGSFENVLFNRSAQSAGPGCMDVCRFWLIWRPSGNQNRPKIRFGGHLGSQNRPKIRFGSHLGGQNRPRMVPKSAQKRPKTEPRGTKTQSSITKTTREPPGRNFLRYGARNPCFPEALWDPKSTRVNLKINAKTGVIFDPCFHRFWSQNQPKSIKNGSQNWFYFWSLFWSILGPKMDQRMVPEWIKNRSQRYQV